VSYYVGKIFIICSVSSIGACMSRIFFINGFICFLEDEWQWNEEGRERGDATSRRR